MDNYKVKITEQAEVQLREILLYISNTLKEPDIAINLFNELQKSILSLDVMPKRIALIDEEPLRSYGIHKMPVKNFLVYFLVNEDLKEVHITAVIYGKRAQLKQLEKMKL